MGIIATRWIGSKRRSASLAERDPGHAQSSSTRDARLRHRRAVPPITLEQALLEHNADLDPMSLREEH